MEEVAEEASHQALTLILTLFDRYWFHKLILLEIPPPSPPPSPPPPPSVAATARADLLLRRHCQSLSGELFPSPTLHIQPRKLQTILSGKESAIGDEIAGSEISSGEEIGWKRGRIRRRGKKRRSEGSKSLSDLEFEELKGFMDLGFTFSDAEAADPRLMSIVPGLQRLRAAAGDGDSSAAEDCGSDAAVDEAAAEISRPYLSEAWEAAAEEEEEKLLRNFRIPVVREGIDLKDQLRFWAHAVASAVR